MNTECEKTQGRDELAYRRCGARAVDALVKGSSYCGRCSKCGLELFATSWIAIAPLWHNRVRVYRDGHEADDPLLEGIVSEISEQIGQLARKEMLILIPVRDSPS